MSTAYLCGFDWTNVNFNSDISRVSGNANSIVCPAADEADAQMQWPMSRAGARHVIKARELLPSKRDER
jgi:hypothetical protein